MTPTGDPKHAFAVIVGVEQCGVFADDPLRGPVRDAIAWFDWFVARGVQPSRIAMFVSPKSDSESLLDEWRARRGAAAEAVVPTEAAWQQFVADTLPKTPAPDGATLFIVWSGHGLVDLRGHERTRRLFYADGTRRVARNLELVSLMKALRTKELAGFAQQIAIVDACANYAIGLTRDDALVEPTAFPLRNLAAGIEQRVLLATAPGQLAQIDVGIGASARESVARFSRSLRDKLGAPAAGQPPWPDFDAAFAAVRQDFALHDAGRQTPVDWCIGTPDDTLPDSSVTLLADVQGSRLLAALAPLDDASLARAFYDALAPSPLTDDHYAAARDGRTAMAALLQQAAPAGGLLPLLRWALQLRRALQKKRDALLRAGQPAPELPLALLVWLSDAGSADAQATYLAEAARRDNTVDTAAACHLLIVEQGNETADDPHTLDSWLFGGEPLQVRALTDEHAPLQVGAQGSGRSMALKTLLDRALQVARGELQIKRPELVVEWALPAQRIDEAVETLLVGMPERERKLGIDQLVVRRLRDRLDALHSGMPTTELDRWERSATTLRARLGTQGLRIAWLDPKRIRDDGLDAQLGNTPDASCIGLQRTPASALLDRPLKWALYDDGLPFACWTDGDWADGEQARLDTDLREHGNLPPLLHAQRLRQRLQNDQRHPCARLRLLWDDPEHDPYATRLQAVQRTG